MDEANTDLKDFDAVGAFSKNCESRVRCRGGAPSAGKGPDAMVYGMSAPEAPVPPPGFAVTAPESLTLDPWAGAVADPWANAVFLPQPPQPPTQPEADWALDAFGKGKGKGKTDGGKGRGPLG